MLRRGRTKFGTMDAGRARARCGAGLRALPLWPALVVLWFAPDALAAQRGQTAERPFPYRLEIVTEASTVAAIAGLHALRDDPEPFDYESEIASLDARDVNPFDRLTVHLFSREARAYSDRSRDLLLMAAGAVVASEAGLNRRFPVLLVMAAEAGFLTSTVTEMSKSRADRMRPYLFNDDLPVEERASFARSEGDALESFFSGHTAAAFASAMFATTVWIDLHGWEGAKARRLRMAALGIAGSTAVARVAGGAHHPSDVLAGALVGSLIGWGVPWLHRSDRAAGWRLMATADGLEVRLPVR